MRTIVNTTDDFIEYCEETRKELCKATENYTSKKDLTLLTEIDNLLIAYDQLVYKLKKERELSEKKNDVIKNLKELIQDLI